MNKKIYWQAHRGGGIHEAPDNTMAAFKYAWNLGGIPEADIRETKDGVIICLHDDTPARTTTAPDSIKNLSISSFNFEEIRNWDSGIKFSSSYKGEKIPSLEEVFEEMRKDKNKWAYLDLKNINLDKLGTLIREYEVNSQIIFTHNLQDSCIRMKNIAAGVKTMLWIGGTPEKIKDKFKKSLESGFYGLDQVQIHLNPLQPEAVSGWSYQIDEEFLKYALTQVSAYDIALEVLPFKFEKGDIERLIALGINWYATDEPSKFLACIS